jgi:hypothetical protein
VPAGALEPAPERPAGGATSPVPTSVKSPPRPGEVSPRAREVPAQGQRSPGSRQRKPGGDSRLGGRDVGPLPPLEEAPARGRVLTLVRQISSLGLARLRSGGRQVATRSPMALGFSRTSCREVHAVAASLAGAGGPGRDLARARNAARWCSEFCFFFREPPRGARARPRALGPCSVFCCSCREPPRGGSWSPSSSSGSTSPFARSRATALRRKATGDSPSDSSELSRKSCREAHAVAASLAGTGGSGRDLDRARNAARSCSEFLFLLSRAPAWGLVRSLRSCREPPRGGSWSPSCSSGSTPPRERLTVDKQYLNAPYYRHRPWLHLNSSRASIARVPDVLARRFYARPA